MHGECTGFRRVAGAFETINLMLPLEDAYVCCLSLRGIDQNESLCYNLVQLVGIWCSRLLSVGHYTCFDKSFRI